MNITAVRHSQDIHADELLGYISFQNIHDVRIHKEDLGKLFDQHQLSRTFLPHEIKPHDAFRRASALGAQTIEIDLNGGKQSARLLVREVKRDTKRIVRNLVREIVDGQNEVTDYVTVGKMEYDRNTEQMMISYDYNYLDEYDYGQLLKGVQDTYNEWTQYHTKDTVRNIVNKIMASTNPVSVQKGGRATFVPKNSKDILLALKAVVEELPSDEPSMVETIPLIDTSDMREMVARRAEEQLTGEITELLTDFTALLGNNQELKPEQIKRYVGKFAELNERTKEYQQLVRKQLTAVSLQVQEALRRVQNAPVKEEEQGA